MRVVIYPEPGQEGRFFDELPNNWHQAHIDLREELEAAGLEVAVWPCEVDKQADVGLCFDFPRYRCNIPDRAMCVMLEPPVVHPRQYDKIMGLPFRRILTFARDFCGGNVAWEPYPLVRYEGPLMDRTKGLCAISGGGKHFDSAVVHGRIYESYYLSRRISYIGMGKDLDLYGEGWHEDLGNRVSPKNIDVVNATNYKGAIREHKVRVMSQYRQAIVFENCYCEGYASEKQYDAHIAGVDALIRGWRPDYEWRYAESDKWAQRVVGHLKTIV